MARKTKQGPAMMPVRNLSKLPGSLRPVESVMTQRPDILAGDMSAFAFYPPGGTLSEMANITLMYASNRRYPAGGDVALIDLKTGEAVLRRIHVVDSDGYVVDQYFPDVKKELPEIRCNREKMPFDDIVRVSVVVMAVMI